MWWKSSVLNLWYALSQSSKRSWSRTVSITTILSHLQMRKPWKSLRDYGYLVTSVGGSIWNRESGSSVTLNHGAAWKLEGLLGGWGPHGDPCCQAKSHLGWTTESHGRFWVETDIIRAVLHPASPPLRRKLWSCPSLGCSHAGRQRQILRSFGISRAEMSVCTSGGSPVQWGEDDHAREELTACSKGWNSFRELSVMAGFLDLRQQK